MRTKLISGIVTAFLLVPVAAAADQHPAEDETTAICYADPTDPVCVPQVLPKEPTAAPEKPVVKPTEVEPAEVLAVTETLARTGIETPAFLALATGLLAAGGLMLLGLRRRHRDSDAT